CESGPAGDVVCARPVRTGAGAPTAKPIPPPTRRSTRPGCECVPTPFAPWAVLLQQNQTQPRTVGAPAPGANACLPRSHRGRCSYNRTTTHLRTVGAPAPGANGDMHGAWIVLARFAPRR